MQDHLILQSLVSLEDALQLLLRPAQEWGLCRLLESPAQAMCLCCWQ